MLTSLLLFALLLAQGHGDGCQPRYYDQESFVCVCDASDCDLPGRLTFPDPGHFTVVTSSRDDLRFHFHTEEVSQVQEVPSSGAIEVEVDFGARRQTMLGFGAAFTDASGFNVDKLTPDLQDVLLRSYYSPEGLEYEIARVPIAGCDFSLSPYSYADVEGDIELEHFSLVEEDIKYKIPQLLRAQEMSARPLKVLGSPWSPPAWMKTNGKFNEGGQLLKEMWQPWADYLVRFVEAYEKEGVPVWGITAQNDPMSGFDPNYAWNSLGWPKEDMRDWIKNNLGPAIHKAGLGHRLRLLIHDNARDTLPWYPRETLSDPEAARYVSGVAVHWYADRKVGPEVLDEVRTEFSDKFILYSEACTGFDAPPDEKVLLGSWKRAESYAKNIIEDVNHWASGWLDWNLALDTEGGPNWAGNRVDAPIIINATANEFLKQPMFYALGHFSKFVPSGSVNVPSRVRARGDDSDDDSDDDDDDGEVHTAAFLHVDGGYVLVVLNTGSSKKIILTKDAVGGTFTFEAPAKSILSVLYGAETTRGDTHARDKYRGGGE